MPITVSSQGTPVLYSGPEATNFFRMLCLLNAMRFELKTGLRRTNKAPSAFTVVKREYGLKGGKQKIIDQFAELVKCENLKMEYVPNTTHS